jgi:molecular chaperone HtpG
MSIEIQETALMTYVKKSVGYHAKILELREAIEGWLAYIPNTFPHYTRHTVRHSDEIVRQISKLLFVDEDPARPVLPLTGVEAYLLMASAYLHDAGMVASDREKLELMQTDEWKTWVSDSNAGAKRWSEIQTFRMGNEPSDEFVRYFLADLEVRFLVAEFIRRSHHLRAKTVIDQHQAMLGRFAFDDRVLQRTIADICVAHGFRTHELENNERFPDRRDIRGEAVNVRLMAVLLRLGDLLDMSADRACPLLLNAACPLPADSLAHWTQYQSITHRLTAPDRIELTADCQNQHEHRVLQDWCQWIVDEIHAARTLLSRSRRHHQYELPVAEIEGSEKTIVIRPANNANYFPSRWTFQLDQEAIFQRLVYDAYDGSEVFIRELIQNALDANRCQMYADLISKSITPPQYPTEVSEEIRNLYPITVSLKWTEVENPLSQETEKRQVLTVADSGIGMDKEIVERYFLQVGRSFYTTEEFRRKFRFIPTSRFGLGFLSTFAVSDLVKVETFKPSSTANDGPVSLTLTGPRNYLLTEVGTRRISGTEIQVLLREPFEAHRLTRLIERWCRKVEFPIAVDDLGHSSTIVAERPEHFTYDIEDVSDQQSRLVVQTFPINRDGIEGELYVFARVTSFGEAWDKYHWAKYEYRTTHPGAAIPEFPMDLKCLHGIAMESDYHFGLTDGYSSRLDYRGEGPTISIARRGRSLNEMDPVIVTRWEEILDDHLSTSPYSTSNDGWRYRQRLAGIFKFEAFWRSLDCMIPLRIQGKDVLVSLYVAEQFPTLNIILDKRRVTGKYSPKSVAVELPVIESEAPALFHDRFLSAQHNKALVDPRVPVSVYWLNQHYLVTTWSLPERDLEPFGNTALTRYFLLEFPITTSIGCGIDWQESRESVLLNTYHPFVQWLVRVKTACLNYDHFLEARQFETLLELLNDPFRYGSGIERLQNYLGAWSKLPDLPRALYPPQIRFSRNLFELPYWTSP